jgi:hypothetical protein
MRPIARNICYRHVNISSHVQWSIQISQPLALYLKPGLYPMIEEDIGSNFFEIFQGLNLCKRCNFWTAGVRPGSILFLPGCQLQI